MWDQVQESVTQQPTGCETQKYLQERLVFVVVIDGYKKQYKKWQDADGYGRRQRFDPQHAVGGFRVGMTVAMVVTVAMNVVVTMVMSVIVDMVVIVVMVVMVMSVARTQFRQSQKNEREHHRPANVLYTFLG